MWRKNNAYIWLLAFLVLALPSCQFILSPAHAPMAVISAYEVTHKRKKWEEFAKQGDVYAQYELAESYRIGMLEGDINGAEAMKWYCEAGRNGFVNAQLALGKMYEGVLVIPRFAVAKDNARAWMWYELAKRRVSEEARTRLEQLIPTMTNQELRDANYLLQAPKQVPCGPEALPWQNPA